jgi:hypothetical protein
VHHYDRTDDHCRADYDYGCDDICCPDIAADDDERTTGVKERTDNNGGTRQQHYSWRHR